MKKWYKRILILIMVLAMSSGVSTFVNAASKAPAKTKITSVKSGSAGAVTIKYKKSSKANGYQIQVATNTKFTKNKKTVTVKSGKTVSKTVSVLKTGTKYYVRVRAYRTVSKKKYYSGWSAKKTVTTKKKSTSSTVTVTLERTSMTITEGKESFLYGEAKDKNGKFYDITWSSSNKAVATVDSDGFIKGVKAGTAVITAKAAGKSATCNVTVIKKKSSSGISGGSGSSSGSSDDDEDDDYVDYSISIEKVSDSSNHNGTSLETAIPGTKIQYKAKSSSGLKVTWSCNDTSVATIDQNGLLTVKDDPIFEVKEVKITATNGKKTASYYQTISPEYMMYYDTTSHVVEYLGEFEQYYDYSKVYDYVLVCTGCNEYQSKGHSVSDGLKFLEHAFECQNLEWQSWFGENPIVNSTVKEVVVYDNSKEKDGWYEPIYKQGMLCRNCFTWASDKCECGTNYGHGGYYIDGTTHLGQYALEDVIFHPYN